MKSGKGQRTHTYTHRHKHTKTYVVLRRLAGQGVDEVVVALDRGQQRRLHRDVAHLVSWESNRGV